MFLTLILFKNIERMAIDNADDTAGTDRKEARGVG